MAVLIWWLDSGAKLPPERVDAMIGGSPQVALSCHHNILHALILPKIVDTGEYR
jgi:hypothetical protein